MDRGFYEQNGFDWDQADFSGHSAFPESHQEGESPGQDNLVSREDSIEMVGMEETPSARHVPVSEAEMSEPIPVFDCRVTGRNMVEAWWVEDLSSSCREGFVRCIVAHHAVTRFCLQHGACIKCAVDVDASGKGKHGKKKNHIVASAQRQPNVTWLKGDLASGWASKLQRNCASEIYRCSQIRKSIFVPVDAVGALDEFLSESFAAKSSTVKNMIVDCQAAQHCTAIPEGAQGPEPASKRARHMQ